MIELLAICYIISVNLAAFFTFGLDKYKAARGQWRIKESTLLCLAVIGGSIGAYLGMRLFHHKTLHLKFRYGLPAIIIIQASLLYFMVR